MPHCFSIVPIADMRPHQLFLNTDKDDDDDEVIFMVGSCCLAAIRYCSEPPNIPCTHTQNHTKCIYVHISWVFDLIFTRTHDLLLRIRRPDTRAKLRFTTVCLRWLARAYRQCSVRWRHVLSIFEFICGRSVLSLRWQSRYMWTLYVPLKLLCVHTNFNTIQYTQNAVLFILL